MPNDTESGGDAPGEPDRRGLWLRVLPYAIALGIGAVAVALTVSNRSRGGIPDARNDAATRASAEPDAAPAADASVAAGAKVDAAMMIRLPFLSGEIERTGDAQFRIRPEVRDIAVEYPQAVLRGASISPVLGERDLAGAKIVSIEAPSVLDALGFEPGDTIYSVNGVRVTETVASLLDAVRGQSLILVEYARRRGTKHIITIRVE